MAYEQKKLLFLGRGRSGKDEACEYLSKITLLRNAGTTSKYLCSHVAKKLGVSVEEAYSRRHESDDMRILWYNTGNEIRANDPTVLLKEALQHGELTGGLRDRAEVVAARKAGLVDLIVWIERKQAPHDPTMKFDSSDCDIVIENHGTLQEYQERLWRLAKFAKLPMRYGHP